jgi:hypothetical protein
VRDILDEQSIPLPQPGMHMGESSRAKVIREAMDRYAGQHGTGFGKRRCPDVDLISGAGQASGYQS